MKEDMERYSNAHSQSGSGGLAYGKSKKKKSTQALNLQP